MKNWILAQLIKKMGHWGGGDRAGMESQRGNWHRWGGKEQESLRSVYSLTKGQENVTCVQVRSILSPVLAKNFFPCTPIAGDVLVFQPSAAGNGASTAMIIWLLLFLVFPPWLPHILLLQAFLWQHSLPLFRYLKGPQILPKHYNAVIVNITIVPSRSLYSVNDL